MWVDGEISFPRLGEVAWREWDAATAEVLLKSPETVELVTRESLLRRLPPHRESYSQILADLAVDSLVEEIFLYPKPGLVSLHDDGAHQDMNAELMLGSAECLRPFFGNLAESSGSFLDELVPLGRQAEAKMLRVTGGVNTHRGAIFTLGLLIATMGQLPPQPTPSTVREALRRRFGPALENHAAPHPVGARHEAMRGFPSVFLRALPEFRRPLQIGIPRPLAALQTFFHLLREVADTNLQRRGGSDGLARARQSAANFLAAGGVERAGWLRRAQAIHEEFVAAHLSPGGAADLLAATLFLHDTTSLYEAGRELLG